jgi:F0F1-type ATP synthase epsilon subunit
MNREDRGPELLADVLVRVLADTARQMREIDERAKAEKRARRTQQLEKRLQQ